MERDHLWHCNSAEELAGIEAEKFFPPKSSGVADLDRAASALAIMGFVGWIFRHVIGIF